MTLGGIVMAASALGSCTRPDNWQTASREPLGIAPDPAVVREAVVQVYAARARGWRGTFGVHTWVATKPTGAANFSVYEVIGWRTLRGQPSVAVSNRAPDSRWFGAPPEILADIRGEGVDDVIQRIDAAVTTYPYNDEYVIWPGPNSNTFVAYLGRAAPELKLELPPTAIGKDYLPNGSVFEKTPSGTGYQLSFFGLFGVMAGPEEGFELNLLGLTFGVDFADPAIKLPLIGRLGRAKAGSTIES